MQHMWGQSEHLPRRNRAHRNLNRPHLQIKNGVENQPTSRCDPYLTNSQLEQQIFRSIFQAALDIKSADLASGVKSCSKRVKRREKSYSGNMRLSERQKFVRNAPLILKMEPRVSYAQNTSMCSTTRTKLHTYV